MRNHSTCLSFRRDSSFKSLECIQVYRLEITLGSSSSSTLTRRYTEFEALYIRVPVGELAYHHELSHTPL